MTALTEVVSEAMSPVRLIGPTPFGVGVMNDLTLEKLADILQSHDESSLIKAVTLCVQQMEFSHFVIGVHVPNPYNRPKQKILNGYPERWRRTYDERNYVSVDPTVEHCLTQTDPLLWNHNTFLGDARRMWEEAHAVGLGYGISLPSRDRTGTITMLSVARDQPLDYSDADRIRVLRRLTALAGCAHLATTNLVVPALLARSVPKLTRRELECLKWLAMGKTAWEIGAILKISERTAVFHIANLVSKLGVTNRTQAVVVGLWAGLLEPDMPPDQGFRMAAKRAE